MFRQSSATTEPRFTANALTEIGYWAHPRHLESLFGEKVDGWSFDGEAVELIGAQYLRIV